MPDQNSTENTIIKITGDGSHTLYSSRFGQHYHSTNGAVAESRHIFFEQNGLKTALEECDQLNILEVGFGTGLNLLLLMDYYYSLKSTAKIQYYSIEAYPISDQKSAALNYEEHLKYPELIQKLLSLFGRLKKGWNTFSMAPRIEVVIFYGFFADYKHEQDSFDFILHDAFSPAANPDLWNAAVFEKLLKWSKSQAVMTTYCAASKARAAMASAGWKAERAQGAAGKREMTVASPTAQTLSHFTRLNEKRLARRYEEGDF
jgi:tRNA U34 5-methylaminomethyl-2-thiouridine-forming methyltransferase MnmC